MYRSADVSAYSIVHLVGDVTALLEALGEKQAVIVGHDWGAPVAWHTAQFRPDLVRGVAALSVPHRPRTSGPPVKRMREVIGEGFYMVYFQRPKEPETEFERNPKATLGTLQEGCNQVLTRRAHGIPEPHGAERSPGPRPAAA
ncbi:alpha/beta fold hydrolase [Nonomuraea sp. M3C6]|uniref:Alpha/beta fold hydrolase n=1 Tax=Nonomuraea marmarensis TaxID=3351344 RepID=A0ABW7ANG2_9ACTN